MPYIERMLSARTKLRRGQALYQSGGRFHSLYALRTGTCKSVIITRDGHDQIIGYHIVGEIVGADGIATDAHECEATALEDMDVCPLPFDQIDDIARISDQFRRNFVKLLSRENRADAIDDDHAGNHVRRPAPGGVPARSVRSDMARAVIRRTNSCCG